jgi:8-oxo-dGTP pyrophosphatase MutT (NUDIX family)
MSPAVLAATVVLLRDVPGGLEVLLLERPQHTGSFAGAWVFPGGKVDPEDFGSGGHDVNDGGMRIEHEVLAARRAGVRETWEETGLRVHGDQLVQLSVWIPDSVQPRRFRTFFFLAPAPVPEQEIVLNVGELEDYAWLSPKEALARHAAGSMSLVPPTWVTLHWLSRCANVETALGRSRTGQPETYQSRQRQDSGGRRLVLWSGDEDYPDAGAAADASARPRTGGRHRLDVSSLPWSYERTDG